LETRNSHRKFQILAATHGNCRDWTYVPRGFPAPSTSSSLPNLASTCAVELLALAAPPLRSSSLQAPISQFNGDGNCLMSLKRHSHSKQQHDTRKRAHARRPVPTGPSSTRVAKSSGAHSSANRRTPNEGAASRGVAAVVSQTLAGASPAASAAPWRR
jgi:hypothetical protein